MLPDAARLAQAAAERFAVLGGEAIRGRGRFAVALAGGSTPRGMYQRLSSTFAERVDWPRAHVFWSDERCVPPDDPDSNYRMAREALLDRVPIPAGNVHRIRAEAVPEEAAAEYESCLRKFFGQHSTAGPAAGAPRPPRFDLILLGMGEDGHAASLFPGTAALSERNRWVIAHYVEKLAAWRITLTLAVINAAAEVMFLVSGARKAETLRRVLAGFDKPPALPAQMVRLADGRLLWLVDAEAASLLPR